MKHAVHRGQLSDDWNHLHSMFDDSDLPFPLTPGNPGSSYEKKPYIMADKDGKVFDPNTMIPKCQIQNAFDIRNTQQREKFGSKCELFQPTPTENGLCYTFNALSPKQLMKKSPFLDAYAKAFEPELKNIIDNTGWSYNGSLQQNPLIFVVDRQTVGKVKWRGTSQLWQGGRDFEVIINNALKPFKVNSGAIKVRYGFSTLIKVTPFEAKSQEDLRFLDINLRKCRFPDEHEDILKIYKQYTQAACQFECFMNYSRNLCRCTPWDFPYPADVEQRTCDSRGYFCYRAAMRKASLESDCAHCVADCDTISFSVTYTQVPLETDDLCLQPKLGFQLLMTKINYFLSLLTYVWTATMADETYGTGHHWNDMPYRKYYGDVGKAICKQMLERDIAIVKVQFATSEFTQSLQTVRVGILEQIANFGNFHQFSSP